MDFHTLSRRDLQALCKRNKIPANMTNVAMADALAALEIVEGLEEVLTHPQADSLNTPARSMAATASVYRTSNRQRTVKEETATSKLTRTRQSTRKDMPEAAPPSTVQQAYSTRRSTRLLEKQMCQLSLKENEDMVDAKAIMEKDSQDMQRQFSEDMDNSLADKTVSDEPNLTEEATEETTVAEVPVQNMNQEPLPIDTSMVLNDNAGDLETPITEVEESINDKDGKDVDEGQPMLEDVMQEDVNGVDAVQDAVSKPDTMTEDEFVLGSESKATDIAIAPMCQPMQKVVLEGEFKATENAVAAVDETQKAIDATDPSDISGENVIEDDDDDEAEQKKALEMQASESAADDDDDDEFDFLSESTESDSNDNDEVDQAVVDNAPEPLLDGDKSANRSSSKKSASARQVVHNESSDSDSDDNEEVDQAVVGDAPEPLLDGDKSANRSSSRKSASAHQVIDNSDNKQKFEISSTLQDENIVVAAATKTPIQDKSLRQLKRMVKERKQKKAEEKRPLQVHAENV